ncbi:uncharacterized protein LOC111088900 [Limulus polyphemus]|uniref:Uncharacterized protein LOC111088900 n=1 Tax=Limulus polyphemus TaxID=6850 RepID=A0ABM1TIZ8_LIMPO|nr:uncharacterized protein LOC111088900 [Limulus polyphemus]
MKLMKWVELRFGRSRRKDKKGKPQDPSEGIKEYSGCLTLTNEVYPEFRYLDNVLPCVLPSRSCLTPQPPIKKKPLNIRTSFLDLAVLPDTNSPRQRPRIRTNPWLPSRGSISSSTSSSSTSSSTSESLENSYDPVVKPSGPWTLLPFCPSGRDFSPLPAIRRIRLLEWNKSDDNQLSCSPKFTREEQFRLQQIVTSKTRDSTFDSTSNFETESNTKQTLEKLARLRATDSYNKQEVLEIDEAFSEDYQLSEDGDSSPTPIPKVATSPQADSACGSCSTTPLSETAQDHVEGSECGESLDEKIASLKEQRLQMTTKMAAARQDDEQRQEEVVRLQQELLDYRRIILLRTLQGLQNRLEQQGERLDRAYSATREMKMNYT